MRVEFEVRGHEPVTQGSITAFGRGRVSHGRPAHDQALRAWRQQIADAAREAMLGAAPFDAAVAVELQFVVSRPLTHHRGRRRSHPLRPDAPEFSASIPDLDKLARAAIDGIGMAEVVWRDDCQVATVGATKRYGASPGVAVAMWSLPEQEPPGVVTLDLDAEEGV